MSMVVIVAEIGANHSGSLQQALALIDAAKRAGCDIVKFQKRTVSLAVPAEQKGVLKETPWGVMPYEAYRERLEFGQREFRAIDEYCIQQDIPWFGSAFDVPSAEFLLSYEPAYIKIPSAKLTDTELLRWIAANHGTAQPILSTGMSTSAQIADAVRILADEDPIILHCTSTYPCPVAELNLRCITTLQRDYPGFTIGYSGHEVGLATTVAAVALGAQMVERHITLDRASWGTDQAASVEPNGFARLVKDIRNVEAALGDGLKKVEPGEEEPMRKLRGVPV